MKQQKRRGQDARMLWLFLLSNCFRNINTHLICFFPLLTISCLWQKHTVTFMWAFVIASYYSGAHTTHCYFFTYKWCPIPLLFFLLMLSALFSSAFFFFMLLASYTLHLPMRNMYSLKHICISCSWLIFSVSLLSTASSA